jgi:hypothetical protein
VVSLTKGKKNLGQQKARKQTNAGLQNKMQTGRKGTRLLAMLKETAKKGNKDKKRDITALQRIGRDKTDAGRE